MRIDFLKRDVVYLFFLFVEANFETFLLTKSYDFHLCRVSDIMYTIMF